ncbi:protein FRA10AC1 [Hordeum vulgare]|nr:protein FRA10AC1 [Hordeum vulgare]
MGSSGRGPPPQGSSLQPPAPGGAHLLEHRRRRRRSRRSLTILPPNPGAASCRQYQSHIRGLNAYDRHNKFMKDYVQFYGHAKNVDKSLPIKTDKDTLREGYRSILSEEDDIDSTWEKRLVKRYYDKLFKDNTGDILTGIGFGWAQHNGKDNLSGQQDVQAAKEDDPKELKRQRNREYYARNKEEILKRRREAREKKHASTTVVNDEENVAHTPLAMTLDVDPNELQMQMVGEHYSQNMDVVLNRQHEAYGDRRLSMVITNLNDQENGTETPVSTSNGPKELWRQRDMERYAQNRDEILKRQRLSREKRKTASRLLNDDTTVSHTPATGQTGVIQLQGLTFNDIGLSSMQNSSDERVTHNQEINLTNEEDSNWLRRNDAYQRQQRHGKDSTIEDAGIKPSHGSNQPVPRPANNTRRAAEPASHGEDRNDDPYGIFEPIVEHTSLEGLTNEKK